MADFGEVFARSLSESSGRFSGRITAKEEDAFKRLQLQKNYDLSTRGMDIEEDKLANEITKTQIAELAQQTSERYAKSYERYTKHQTGWLQKAKDWAKLYGDASQTRIANERYDWWKKQPEKDKRADWLVNVTKAEAAKETAKATKQFREMQAQIRASQQTNQMLQTQIKMNAMLEDQGNEVANRLMESAPTGVMNIYATEASDITKLMGRTKDPAMWDKLADYRAQIMKDAAKEAGNYRDYMRKSDLEKEGTEPVTKKAIPPEVFGPMTEQEVTAARSSGAAIAEMRTIKTPKQTRGIWTNDKPYMTMTRHEAKQYGVEAEWDARGSSTTVKEALDKDLQQRGIKSKSKKKESPDDKLAVIDIATGERGTLSRKYFDPSKYKLVGD